MYSRERVGCFCPGRKGCYREQAQPASDAYAQGGGTPREKGLSSSSL
jgi:hypothetical protein